MQIKSINIEIGGKVYELEFNEAKQLYEELDKLFAIKTTTYISPYVNKPYVWPSITWGNTHLQTYGNTTAESQHAGSPM